MIHVHFFPPPFASWLKAAIRHRRNHFGDHGDYTEAELARGRKAHELGYAPGKFVTVIREARAEQQRRAVPRRPRNQPSVIITVK